MNSRIKIFQIFRNFQDLRIPQDIQNLSSLSISRFQTFQKCIAAISSESNSTIDRVSKSAAISKVSKSRCNCAVSRGAAMWIVRVSLVGWMGVWRLGAPGWPWGARKRGCRSRFRGDGAPVGVHFRFQAAHVRYTLFSLCIRGLHALVNPLAA